MWTYPENWEDIIADDHDFEYCVAFGTETAAEGFENYTIINLSAESTLFSGESPGVGGCLAAELTVSIIRPETSIPRMAKVRPYVRVTNGTLTSGWLPQGVFYIDTRECTQNDDGLDILTLHCYDAMLKAETGYPSTEGVWPKYAIDVVAEIAGAMGVGVDSRTDAILATQEYEIGAPVGYTMREVLSYIASMYAGNWIMNYDGGLLLVTINGIPAETNYLVEENGFAITFGVEPIEETASGSVVAFNGYGTPFSSISIAINPVQSGTGTPAPDNIRPFSGWTGAKIQQCGKNLISTQPTLKYSSSSLCLDFGKDVTFANVSLSFTAVNAIVNASVAAAFANLRKNDGTHQYLLLRDFTNESGIAFNTVGTSYNGRFRASKANITFRYLNVYYMSSGYSRFASDCLSDFQLEVGSAATAYEPYTGTTYEVDWTDEAGTVYGGTAVYNGNETWTLTMDRAKVSRSTSTGGTSLGTYSRYSVGLGQHYGTHQADPNKRPQAICDCIGTYRATFSEDSLHFYITTAGTTAYFFLPTGETMDVSMVYYIADPQTYTITTEELISTLMGENNIWSDTGDISVSYEYGGGETRILV